MEKVRMSLLAVIFGSVLLVLVRTILAPTSGSSTVANSTVAPFVFPTAVPLPKWQPDSSRPLAAQQITESPEYLSGRHYRYIQNTLTLDIEMRYMVNTSGDVKYFIQNYSSMPPNPGQLELVLRQQEGIGFYSLGTYKQRAYLSTCINSRGGSTVTTLQFTLNRYIYDYMHLDRLLSWLLDQEIIPDQRCLWTHLSIPLKNSSQTDAYQTLENAWESWYKWWRPRFPQS